MHFFTLTMKYQKQKVTTLFKTMSKANKKQLRNKPNQGCERSICWKLCYMTLIKEDEDDSKRWKIIQCSWTGRMNTIKMAIQLKAIYRFNAILIKISVKTRTNNPKIYMEPQKIQNCQSNSKWVPILRKKNKVESITLPDIRLYYKDTAIKTV